MRNVSKKTGKKRKNASGKRQRKQQASRHPVVNTPLTTPVEDQLNETESQSSNSTIDNSYVADDQNDTISESDKQTDDSNNCDGETDSSTDTQNADDFHSTSQEQENENSESNENSHLCSDTEPYNSKQEEIDENESTQDTESRHSRSPSPTLCSTNGDQHQTVTNNFIEADEIDLAHSQSPENTTNNENVTDLNENNLEARKEPQANDECHENKTPTDQEDESVMPIVKEPNVDMSYAAAIYPGERNSEDSIMEPNMFSKKDDSNNNIADSEMVDSLALNDDIKENKSTDDTKSRDLSSPQETNISPPRESRLQCIIEQLRVNRQKGMHKYDDTTDNKAVTNPASSDDDNDENGENQEQIQTEEVDILKNDDSEKINKESSEKSTDSLQEENSCSRTEGRCSVKDKPRNRYGHIQNPDNFSNQNSDLRFESVNSYYEQPLLNADIDKATKRKMEHPESYGDYQHTYLQSDMAKRHKSNEYIKLSKPSKSDIIVNGLLDTIYTEKKREQQLKEVKKDTIVTSSERANPHNEIKNNMADMFPNKKYSLQTDKIPGQNTKGSESFKPVDFHVDIHRSQKSENKLSMHSKSQGPREEEPMFRSTLPKSPKSGSTYPASFINLKSKDSRSDKVHGHTAPSSIHKSSEFSKPEKASSSHSENIYNDYMRLLAATQSNFHLIPHPAVDPYFMMRMSEMSYTLPYFHSNMLKRDASTTDKTDLSSSSALGFMPPPFPPLGFMHPGLPFGFPPPFSDAYKGTVSPSSGSVCKKSNVSPGSTSAKRRPDEDHDALDLSAKKPKYRDDHPSTIETQPDRYREHKTIDHKIHIGKMTENIHHTARQHHSGDRIDYRKMHHSWIDKSDKVAKPVCKCSAYNNDDIRNWTVDKVYRFVAKLDGCSSYAEIFREHRLDGKRLHLLTTEQLVKSLGMKVGPAITLSEAVTKKIQEQSRNYQPCDYCKRKSNHRISI
ncbi:hypothetical protein KUTeg_003656 [Tegillarca granosa]|uniref:SAM domain-containing protein n=1 Tax=Tegillarca granosa TaxID=220873 RepID=A0ABQ9FQM5_TEGGR|nr:hypothetical protein KUTeg_003656 [Tegillarca granosa]